VRDAAAAAEEAWREEMRRKIEALGR
jgi:hypothetical protein